MKTIESSGKTVKDAINQGAKELGCDPSDLEIEVLEMGSPGLFGMFGRLARVKLTLKEADDDFNIDMPAMTLEQPAQKQGRQHRQEKPKPAPAPQETAQEETAQKEPSRRSRQRARKERAPEEKPVEAEIVITPPEPEAPFVETAYDQLSDDAKRAMEFLSGMIERMGVQAELKACETPEQLRVQLFGENMSLLIRPPAAKRSTRCSTSPASTSTAAARNTCACRSIPKTIAPSARKRCANWPRAWPTAAARPASAWRWSR